jgi:tetratricopeptide (TPR) repeat protein
MNLQHSSIRAVALMTIALLLPLGAFAEVHLQNDVKEPRFTSIISDGPKPWKLKFYTLQGHGKWIPASATRAFWVNAGALHLIDIENGIVLRRWIFVDQIDDVQPKGSSFLVRTSRPGVGDGAPPITQTIEMTPDSPSPPYWLDSLLRHRIAITEGQELDTAAGLSLPLKGRRTAHRPPLAPEAAEKLLVELKDAARRDPFSLTRSVDLALVMKDAGRSDAKAFFIQALDRPSNLFSELLMVAGSLEDVGEEEWSTLAFDRGYAMMWKQGCDPRLVAALLPRLIMLYLPYALREVNPEIPALRRAKLQERLYEIGPYTEGAYAAWSVMAAYFNAQGDPEKAELWRRRAAEAASKSGYIWEPLFYLENLFRVLVALFVSLWVYVGAIQWRYAPQRALIRSTRSTPRWRDLSHFSLTCWDRYDRQGLYMLCILLWLATGLTGAFIHAAKNMSSWPIGAGPSGTMQSPATREYFERLDASPERDFLMALSLQQAERLTDAESLYRTLPDSAAAWNNLGVVQSAQGKQSEARESFQHALRIEPGNPEAAFNLGQPVADFWINLRSQYLVGQKATALPSHDLLYRVFRGNLANLTGRMLKGPLSVNLPVEFVSELYTDTEGAHFARFARIVRYLYLSSILALVMAALLSPYAEVTQPPGRRHWLIELVLPGTAHGWGRWGGIVTGIMICVIVEIASMHRPWLAYFMDSTGLTRVYGLPASIDPLQGKWYGVWAMNMPRFWPYLLVTVIVVIYGVNAAMVLRSQRRKVDQFSSE